MKTLNYQDFQNMVTNYRTRNATQPNWAPVSLNQIQQWDTDLQNLGADGVRIYLALADSNISDTTGNRVFSSIFDGYAIMIAVPTLRNPNLHVDDLIGVDPVTGQQTIDCDLIGCAAYADNMGMCPPICGSALTSNAI